MKNVTIALDDETHKAARVYAAQHGTSLSALVKGYLEQLGSVTPPAAGVRDMPMPFSAHPAKAAEPPLPAGAYGLFADGTPYYTRDGKPRTPGGLKGKIGMVDDCDDWPEDMLAYFDRLQSEPFDGDRFDPMP